ncbi:MAG: hypothetical protein LIR50_13640 [Bacillota bacterium]|nr:hypothetical protein [Bacillota bacterium]
MIVIIPAVFICLVEWLTLSKKGMRKEFTAVCILLFLSVFIQISKQFDIITLPEIIEKLLEPIGKMYLKKL